MLLLLALLLLLLGACCCWRRLMPSFCILLSLYCSFVCAVAARLRYRRCMWRAGWRWMPSSSPPVVMAETQIRTKNIYIISFIENGSVLLPHGLPLIFFSLVLMMMMIGVVAALFSDTSPIREAQKVVRLLLMTMMLGYVGESQPNTAQRAPHSHQGKIFVGRITYKSSSPLLFVDCGTCMYVYHV